MLYHFEIFVRHLSAIYWNDDIVMVKCKNSLTIWRLKDVLPFLLHKPGAYYPKKSFKNIEKSWFFENPRTNLSRNVKNVRNFEATWKSVAGNTNVSVRRRSQQVDLTYGWFYGRIYICIHTGFNLWRTKVQRSSLSPWF